MVNVEKADDPTVCKNTNPWKIGETDMKSQDKEARCLDSQVAFLQSFRQIPRKAITAGPFPIGAPLWMELLNLV